MPTITCPMWVKVVLLALALQIGANSIFNHHTLSSAGVASGDSGAPRPEGWWSCLLPLTGCHCNCNCVAMLTVLSLILDYLLAG